MKHSHSLACLNQGGPVTHMQCICGATQREHEEEVSFEPLLKEETDVDVDWLSLHAELELSWSGA